MAPENIDVETREWLDRLEIQDLIHRYSDGVTRADWQQCEAVFTPDATWESSGLGIRCDNRASFMEILRATSSYDLLIQTAHSPVITLIDAHHARSTTTIHEFIRETAAADNGSEDSGAENNLEQYGIYYDDLARVDGSWKFTHRVFLPIYVGRGCVTGDLLTPRSALLRGD
jgi:SnoaL-like domain